MQAIVLNDGTWTTSDLLIQCKDGEPKIGQKINGIEIVDIPIIISTQNSYLLRLKGEHNLKRKDIVYVTD